MSPWAKNTIFLSKSTAANPWNQKHHLLVKFYYWWFLELKASSFCQTLLLIIPVAKNPIFWSNSTTGKPLSQKHDLLVKFNYWWACEPKHHLLGNSTTGEPLREKHHLSGEFHDWWALQPKAPSFCQTLLLPIPGVKNTIFWSNSTTGEPLSLNTIF